MVKNIYLIIKKISIIFQCVIIFGREDECKYNGYDRGLYSILYYLLHENYNNKNNKSKIINNYSGFCKKYKY